MVFSLAAGETWSSFVQIFYFFVFTCSSSVLTCVEQKEAKIQDPLEASLLKTFTHDSPSESGQRYNRRKIDLLLIH